MFKCPFLYTMEYTVSLIVFLNITAWQSKNLTNLDQFPSIVFRNQMKQNYGTVNEYIK